MLEVNFTPFPEIITDRLLLRKITHRDLNQILRLRSSDQTMKYVDREKAVTPGDAENFLTMIDQSLEANTGVAWGISLKDNPELLIGYVGHWRLIKEHYRAEVGYMLLPEYWKKGIMKEALSAAIKYGFDTMKLHSIEARINPENVASAALLESTGFVREAWFKEDYFYKGKFGDTVVYSKLQS